MTLSKINVAHRKFIRYNCHHSVNRLRRLFSYCRHPITRCRATAACWACLVCENGGGKPVAGSKSTSITRRKLLAASAGVPLLGLVGPAAAISTAAATRRPGHPGLVFDALGE